MIFFSLLFVLLYPVSPSPIVTVLEQFSPHEHDDFSIFGEWVNICFVVYPVFTLDGTYQILAPAVNRYCWGSVVILQYSLIEYRVEYTIYCHDGRNEEAFIKISIEQ